MSPLLPGSDSTEEPGQPGTRRATSTAAALFPLLLLLIVLGALVALLVKGIELPEAITIIGVSGLLTVELRKRLT